jgi:hypothetical protein
MALCRAPYPSIPRVTTGHRNEPMPVYNARWWLDLRRMLDATHHNVLFKHRESLGAVKALLRQASGRSLYLNQLGCQGLVATLTTAYWHMQHKDWGPTLRTLERASIVVLRQQIDSYDAMIEARDAGQF